MVSRYERKINKELSKRHMNTENLSINNLAAEMEKAREKSIKAGLDGNYDRKEVVSLFALRDTYPVLIADYKKCKRKIDTSVLSEICDTHTKKLFDNIAKNKNDKYQSPISPIEYSDVTFFVYYRLNKDVVPKLKAPILKGKKSQSIDPNAYKRVKRLLINYREAIDQDKYLAAGRLVKGDNEDVQFIAPNNKEDLIISLKTRREFVYRVLDSNGYMRVSSVGGAVSSTTLKELKESVNDFSKKSATPEYWVAVSKYINKHL